MEALSGISAAQSAEILKLRAMVCFFIFFEMFVSYFVTAAGFGFLRVAITSFLLLHCFNVAVSIYIFISILIVIDFSIFVFVIIRYLIKLVCSLYLF